MLVKGVSRRVILVKSPDPRLFEQAIFIVREDAFGEQGISAEQVLDEARRVADGYIKRHSRWRKRLGKVPAPAFMAAGAGMTGILWLLLTIL